jgi:energy-coupling factor transporter transmembrane protein EcfT
MEARAYGVFKERTSMVEFKFRWFDWVTLILVLVFSVSIFLF